MAGNRGTVFFTMYMNIKTLSYEIIIVFDCGNYDNRLVIRRIRMERWRFDSHFASISSYLSFDRLYQERKCRLTSSH
jgi:hypothetical protein